MPRWWNSPRSTFPNSPGRSSATSASICVIDDGMKYVAKTDRRFDVIIVDSTDPQGPGKVLFSRNSMPPAALHEARRRHGHAERRSDFAAGELTTGIGKFGRLFADGSCYVAAIPTYMGGHMAMGWATDNPSCGDSAQTIADRYKKAGSFKTKYWTPEVHERPSPCRASSPNWWRKRPDAVSREWWPSWQTAGGLAGPIEAKLDHDVDSDRSGRFAIAGCWAPH